MASNTNPSITLYTGQSPNGIKISILLEELGLPYTVREVDMKSREQKSEWFLRINPNGRIPAITDTLEDGTEVRIFESGSIMQYLVDRYDSAEYRVSYPRGTKEHIEMTSWLFFQNAGVGPMQGQANHFVRYAGEGVPYAVDRYVTETNRLYSILEQQLREKGPYLVGDKCTIADIALWGWVSVALWASIDINKYPALKEWDALMLARPGVEKGRHCPNRDLREILSDPVRMADLEQKGRAVNQASAKMDRDELKTFHEKTPGKQ